MKTNYVKKKRIVDIYFVLYLAALVLIIPGPNDKSKTNTTNSVFELPIAVRPEKSTLFCRIGTDNGTEKILFLDSINTIYYTGEVDEINYEFTVEDQNLKQKITLSQANSASNRFFKITENQLSKTAVFKWFPPSKDLTNKTYIVHVTATAKPKNSPDNSTVKVYTRFSLVMSYYDKEGSPLVPQIENQDLVLQQNQVNGNDNSAPAYTPPAGDFSLSLKNSPVNTIAYEDWENEVFVLGALNPQTDLLKNPELKVFRSSDNNGGSAYIANYFSNGILIKGKAPAFGSMKVQLNLVRKYDKKEASAVFNVIPQSVGAPEFEPVMYPGRTYTINPNMPFTAGKEMKAMLKENDKIRSQNIQGGSFSFTPSIVDTGKVFSFERYVDNNIFGQKYKIYVNSYPYPEIKRIQNKSKNEVIIQTASFGYHNGKSNVVSYLEIKGNASVREKFGDYRADKDKLVWTQFFEIYPKDPSKPFVFSLKAVDTRGFKSEIKEYEDE